MSEITYRIALNNIALAIFNNHNLLRLEGDNQDRSLFHHLAHLKLEICQIQNARLEFVFHFDRLTNWRRENAVRLQNQVREKAIIRQPYEKDKKPQQINKDSTRIDENGQEWKNTLTAS